MKVYVLLDYENNLISVHRRFKKALKEAIEYDPDKELYDFGWYTELPDPYFQLFNKEDNSLEFTIMKTKLEM